MTSTGCCCCIPLCTMLASPRMLVLSNSTMQRVGFRRGGACLSRAKSRGPARATQGSPPHAPSPSQGVPRIMSTSPAKLDSFLSYTESITSNFLIDNFCTCLPILSSRVRVSVSFSRSNFQSQTPNIEPPTSRTLITNEFHSFRASGKPISYRILRQPSLTAGESTVNQVATMVDGCDHRHKAEVLEW